tara:strand:+ start:647 stop:841 length:195 start_codon:yes stop_codon:yes gene_type:complete
MPRIRWGKNEKGELVPITPKKFDFSQGSINNYINMRKTLSGTTKVEFSETTVDESIAKMNRNKR